MDMIRDTDGAREKQKGAVSDRRRCASVIALVGAWLWSSGCDMAPATSVAAVRDSAGVQIIESDAERTGEADSWILSEAPVVQIGARDGPVEYQLSLISNVWRTSDGRIVIADRMPNTVRLYDEAGSFLRVFGGQGDGPGEFRTLTWAGGYVADSIAVWDGAARRVTIFDADGRVGRTFSILLPPNEAHGEGAQGLISSSRINGALADGSLVVTQGVQLNFHPGERRADPRTLLRYSNTGDRIGSLGTFPGPEIATSTGPPPIPTPFPRPFLVVLQDQDLYIGASSRFEIQVWGSNATLRRSIRLLNEDLVLDESDRRTWRANQLALRLAADGDRATIEQALDAVIFPETRPPFAQLVVSSEGHVWARSYAAGPEDAPSVWRIFDAEGLFIGSVQTPAGLEVYQVGSDFVLGVSTDEFQVPYVRLHALVRS